MAHEVVNMADVDDAIETALEGVSGASAPTGTIVMFAVASPPTGWLLCDGSTKAQATYPDLYALIGSTYGSDAGGDFTLPDLRGRFPLGVDGSHALASTGGAINHTHTTPDHTHTVTQPNDHAAHTHSYSTVINHTHTLSSYRGATSGSDTTLAGGLTAGNDTSSTAVTGTTSNPSGGAASGNTGNPSATLTHTGASVTSSGNGTSGSGNPPYIAVHYIIKT